MNNFLKNLKNVLLNRNSVVILAVLAGVVVLWLIYNTTLNNAISPKRVPVAARDLPAGTMITSDDIEFVEVNNDFVKSASIITTTGRLYNYYVNNGTSIAKGAMFYTSQVVDKSELVDRDLELIPEGYTMYWLKVDNTSTYANSIYPGDKIDLWIKIQNQETNNLVVYEEFITSIEVLAVKDSAGANVFDVSTGNRTPANLAFAVPTEMWKTLKNIEDIRGMQLFPVPKNKLYTKEGAEMAYANDQIKTLIDSYVMNIDD